MILVGMASVGGDNSDVNSWGYETPETLPVTSIDNAIYVPMDSEHVQKCCNELESIGMINDSISDI